MPGNSILAGSSGNGGSSPHDSDGGGPSKMMGIGDDDVKNLNGSGGDLFEGDRSTAGNRWPRQETLALLKIRSDMDVTFRDSSLKGPLWEEVSRKMGELGYHRTAKKCKEKFENVYKYHKRTKDGRVGKSEGKTYKFFDQLKALEQPHHQSSSSLPPQPPRGLSEAPPEEAVPVTMIIPAGTIPVSVTVPSKPHPVPIVHTTSISAPPQQNNVNPTNPTVETHKMDHPNVIPNHSWIQMEDDPSATQSSSSWSSSDGEEMVGRKRKRKWKDFFERLMKEVIEKQEELQKRFLEAVEKQEHDRMAREEAWKMQEKARLNREHDILAQERSMSAAKDAALMAFLQKLSQQQQIPLPLPFATTTTSTADAIATATPQLQQWQSQQHIIINNNNNNNNVVENSMASPSSQKPPHQVVVGESNMDNFPQPSSSRWPKDEIQALINLRTSLDQKYQDNGPKGPLWEEISGLMKQMGYNRNAKRCKEKWENINKYFKRVKESNKKRPEDSKTCPYFHQLDALYRMKNKMEMKAPIMGQQWPPTHMGDEGSEDQDDSGDDAHQDNNDHHHHHHHHHHDGGSGYQIIINPNDDRQMRA